MRWGLHQLDVIQKVLPNLRILHERRLLVRLLLKVLLCDFIGVFIVVIHLKLARKNGV